MIKRNIPILMSLQKLIDMRTKTVASKKGKGSFKRKVKHRKRSQND